MCGSDYANWVRVPVHSEQEPRNGQPDWATVMLPDPGGPEIEGTRAGRIRFGQQ